MVQEAQRVWAQETDSWTMILPQLWMPINQAEATIWYTVPAIMAQRSEASIHQHLVPMREVTHDSGGNPDGHI